MLHQLAEKCWGAMLVDHSGNPPLPGCHGKRLLGGGGGLPGGTPFRKCPADGVGGEGSLDAADCCARQQSATGGSAGETW